MELYSDHDEYMTTCQGVLVEEVQDKHIYLLQHSFETPPPKCTLKVIIADLWKKDIN